ncbi:MAG TPA: hypothetical protein VFO36_09825, partial [Nitrospiraceae bacterium]|nr:hypothetical protein [Nitrospiraceae bacterium]
MLIGATISVSMTSQICWRRLDRQMKAYRLGDICAFLQARINGFELLRSVTPQSTPSNLGLSKRIKPLRWGLGRRQPLMQIKLRRAASFHTLIN